MYEVDFMSRRKGLWRESEVNRVIPKNYPGGNVIPPDVRREMYAYYLLEKRLKRLKQVERLSGKGKKRLKRVM